MKRVAQTIVGIALIGVLLAWIFLRHEEPLDDWASSNTLLGWVFQGFAWLCCLGGVALIADAWFRVTVSAGTTVSLKPSDE